MSNLRRKLKAGSIALGGVLLLSMSATTIAQPEIQATSDSNGVMAQGYSGDDIASMSIRLVGPDGFVFEDRVEDSVIDWVPEGELADGIYTWETRMVTVESGAPPRDDPKLYRQKETATVQDGSNARVNSLESAETETRPEVPLERFFDDEYKHVEKASGRFRVRNGFIEPIDNSDGELSQTRQPGLIGSIAGAVLDFVFPSAHAQQTITDDLILQDLSPCLRYDDTDTTSGDSDWNACSWVGEGFFIKEGSSADTGGGVSTAQFAIEEGAPNSSLFIRSNGDVGLGTITPTANLHIADTAPLIKFEDTTGGQEWSLAANETNLAFISNSGVVTVPFRIEPAAPTNALYVADTGNVGLGTSSPSAALDVTSGGINAAGDINADGDVIATGEGKFRNSVRVGDDFVSFLRLNHDTQSDWFGENINGDFRIREFGASNQIPLFLESGGNVGIGTASPQTALHVEGTGYVSGLLGVGTTTPAGELDVRGPGNVIPYFQSSTNEAVQFRLRTDSANRRLVGVNQANQPQSQIIFEDAQFKVVGPATSDVYATFNASGLQVNGDISSDGTTLNVPDYVLTPAYNLRPLSEVQAHIEEHGHLPDVPSASQINKDGLRHAEFQMLLLKKIEELTLYTLEQQDVLEKQQEIIERLSKHNNSS